MVKCLQTNLFNCAESNQQFYSGFWSILLEISLQNHSDNNRKIAVLKVHQSSDLIKAGADSEGPAAKIRVFLGLAAGLHSYNYH